MGSPYLKNRKLLGLFVGLLLLAWGGPSCARKPYEKRVEIPREFNISSVPRKTDLYLNGEYKGRTPIKLKLTPNKKYTVILEEPGFLRLKRNITVFPASASEATYALRKDSHIDCEHIDAIVPTKDLDTSTPAAVWILNRKADIRNCPGTGGSVPYRRRYLRRFFTAKDVERKVGGSYWYLLLHNIGGSSGDLFVKAGWIESRELLDDKFPLVNPNTNVNYRVLVHRPVGILPRTVPLYSNADLTGPPVTRVPVDSIFHIYRLYPAAAEATIENSIPSSVTSLLIGKAPILDSFLDDARTRISGWIDPSFAVLWNTSNAIDLRTKRRVYRDWQGVQKGSGTSHVYRSAKETAGFDPMPAAILEERRGSYKVYLSDSIPFQEGSRAIGSKFGWVREGNNGSGLIYLVDFLDFLRLQRFFDELIDSTDTPLEIHKDWAAIIRFYTGIPCNPTSKLRDCIAESSIGSLLPLRNKFLDYSLRELVELKQINQGKSQDIFCDLQKTKRLMMGILENRKLVLKAAENDSCGMSVQSKKDRNYWFKSGNFPMGWIPMEDIP